MKKFLTVLCSVILMALCLSIAACNKTKEPVKVDENTVIITANSDSFNYENKTLKDYMDYLQTEGKLTFEFNDGMIVSLNGKANTLKSFWMIYTSDAENANNEWGTFEYEGKTYGSATKGAGELAIKENCLYVFAYQTF